MRIPELISAPVSTQMLMSVLRACPHATRMPSASTQMALTPAHASQGVWEMEGHSVMVSPYPTCWVPMPSYPHLVPLQTPMSVLQALLICLQIPVVLAAAPTWCVVTAAPVKQGTNHMLLQPIM